ncbi:hypothetical protein MUB24_04440 [Lederbergia sp. NSJ-179]|uniref:hypothetical protein n=1 Tax=Lederbergia sp. NSJ-179 TaxID=2931402 RepID=UPI001FD0F83C|nr:hypothetical protein [Lederbergia sp. NSJ-179]MCJ7840171.1 hypothetical protein [Lederbergia sp. NSJ-179]
MNQVEYQPNFHSYPSNMDHDHRLIGRPFGFGRPFGYRPWIGRPFGYGAPLLGGFLGGLAAGSLLRPYPYPYPIYPIYPYGGFYW